MQIFGYPRNTIPGHFTSQCPKWGWGETGGLQQNKIETESALMTPPALLPAAGSEPFDLAVVI